MFQKYLAEWAFKELQLTTLPSYPNVSRLYKKRLHAYDERRQSKQKAEIGGNASRN